MQTLSDLLLVISHCICALFTSTTKHAITNACLHNVGTPSIHLPEKRTKQDISNTYIISTVSCNMIICVAAPKIPFPSVVYVMFYYCHVKLYMQIEK